MSRATIASRASIAPAAQAAQAAQGHANPWRYLVARNGRNDLWFVTLGHNETAEQGEQRLRDARGVLWKWDGITQLAITHERPRGVCCCLDRDALPDVMLSTGARIVHTREPNGSQTARVEGREGGAFTLDEVAEYDTIRAIGVRGQA